MIEPHERRLVMTSHRSAIIFSTVAPLLRRSVIKTRSAFPIAHDVRAMSLIMAWVKLAADVQRLRFGIREIYAR